MKQNENKHKNRLPPSPPKNPKPTNFNRSGVYSFLFNHFLTTWFYMDCVNLLSCLMACALACKSTLV